MNFLKQLPVDLFSSQPALVSGKKRKRNKMFLNNYNDYFDLEKNTSSVSVKCQHIRKKASWTFLKTIL